MAELKDLVCADCGHEHQGDWTKPCSACGSMRVILTSVAAEIFGEDWRETCFDKKTVKSTESGSNTER